MCPRVIGGQPWFARRSDRDIKEQPVTWAGLRSGEGPLELISTRLARHVGARGLSPNTAITDAAIRPHDGLKGPRHELGLLESVVDRGLEISALPDVQPGIVVATIFDPDGGMATSGPGAVVDGDKSRDVDGTKPVLPVPIIDYLDLVGRQT